MKGCLHQFLNWIYLYNGSINAGLQGQEAFVPIHWALTALKGEVIAGVCKAKGITLMKSN